MDHASPPRNTGRRAAWVFGLATLALYAGGAWLSGATGPIARRPVLDGGGFCPPYRFVDPPAELAHQNKQPQGGEFPIGFNAEDGKSDAGVHSTVDQQASVVLSRGAIPAAAGAESVHMTIQPADSDAAEGLPAGQSVLGNVVRVTTTYVPSGEAVAAPDRSSLISLVYPSLTTERSDRTLWYSSDGNSWTKLETTNDPNGCQAQADLERMNGLFAVVTTGQIPTQGSGGSGSVLPWVVIGVAVVVAAILVVLRLRARRTVAATATGGRADAVEPRSPIGSPGAPRGSSTRRRPPKKRRR